MALDWTNFTPNRIPKSPVNKENVDMSVPPDAEVSGDPTEITMGPKKVFKRGYPTGKTVGVEGSDKLGGRRMSSKMVGLLTAHGVADGSQVERVLYPEGMSLLQSIVDQKAFLVTKDFKVVDIAAHEWPIDFEKARDVRTVLNASVKYGEEIGVVAGIHDDYVMIKLKAGDLLVSIHDLEPLMGDVKIKSSEPENSYLQVRVRVNEEVDKYLDGNERIINQIDTKVIETIESLVDELGWTSEVDYPGVAYGLDYGDIETGSQKGYTVYVDMGGEGGDEGWDSVTPDEKTIIDQFKEDLEADLSQKFSPSPTEEPQPDKEE